MVQRLKALSVPIALCPQHIELAAPSLPIGYLANSVPVSLLADRPIQRWDAVVKGAEDLIIGGIITISLLPVLALIALAIRLDGPGPIIFKQRRHALNNREFDVYKFRTMRWSDPVIDSLRQTSRNDSRITRIGRLLRSSSLDELPQLFNVLKGEMSLVGPRPHAVDMRTEERLGHEITDMYAHRHRVKPGITGWSQVNGARGATDTTAQLQRRVELDLHYIANWSLLLDLRILALTARVVIGRTNAY
jgi:exopolysaccharide biosynthesis polyprenyl glycosylphosphotransferase